MRQAYKALFGDDGTLKDRLEKVSQDFTQLEAVEELIAFLRAESSRGISQPK